MTMISLGGVIGAGLFVGYKTRPKRQQSAVPAGAA